jgi:hypothetical protein
MCGLQRASKGFDGTEPRNSPASPTMPRQLGPKGRSDLRTSLPHRKHAARVALPTIAPLNANKIRDEADLSLWLGERR